jgi:hypothetical protein
VPDIALSTERQGFKIQSSTNVYALDYGTSNCAEVGLIELLIEGVRNPDIRSKWSC